MFPQLRKSSGASQLLKLVRGNLRVKQVRDRDSRNDQNDRHDDQQFDE